MLTFNAIRILAVRPGCVQLPASGGGPRGRLRRAAAPEEQRRHLGQDVGAQPETRGRPLLVHDRQGVPGAGAGEARRAGEPGTAVVLPAVLVPGALAGRRAPDAPLLNPPDVAELAD